MRIRFKQAAGLVPVQRLAGSISYEVTQAAWPAIEKFLDEYAEKKHEDVKASFLEQVLPARISYAIDKSGLHDFKLADKPNIDNMLALKNEQANDLMRGVHIQFLSQTRGDTNVASFAIDTLGDPDQRVEVYLPTLFRYIIKKFELNFTKQEFDTILTDALAHELHHAADWAYQEAVNKSYYESNHAMFKEDAGLPEYFNADTELKSFALNMGQATLTYFKNKGLLNTPESVQELIGMNSTDFWEYTKSSSKGYLWKHVLPENRKVFIQRVWSYVRKELERTVGFLKHINKLTRASIQTICYKCKTSSNHRYLIIGDLHGMDSELQQLWNQLDPSPSDTVIFLGDLINKGPSSNGVVEFIRDKATTHNVVLITGNHEAAYIRDYHKIKQQLADERLEQLVTKDNVAYLETGVPHFQFVSGGKKFVCVHGGFYPAYKSKHKLKLHDNDKAKELIHKHREVNRHLVKVDEYIDILKRRIKGFGSVKGLSLADKLMQDKELKYYQRHLYKMQDEKQELQDHLVEYKDLINKIEQLYTVRHVDSKGHPIPKDPVTKQPVRPGDFWADTYKGEYGTAFYGHQPYEEVAVHPHAYGIDTGAVKNNKLTAAIVQDGEVAFSSVEARSNLLKGKLDEAA